MKALTGCSMQRVGGWWGDEEDCGHRSHGPSQDGLPPGTALLPSVLPPTSVQTGPRPF